MAQVLVTESYLNDIADAIREKNGSEDTYTPAQMAGAIEGIHTADEFVLVSKSVTANGTYNPASDSADGYSDVTVNVPNTYTASDNGKVVVNQALTDQTSKSINSNGTHDTTANNIVVVDVPNSYEIGDEGKVVHSGALVVQTSRPNNITENGTYDTTLNNEVVVNVAGSGGDSYMLPKFIDAVFCGSSQAESSQSQTVSIINRNGKYGILIVLHRVPITISQSSSSDVAIQGVTPIDLNRADSVEGTQYISVYKILIDSDQYNIYIRSNSSGRLAASVWVSDDDFALSYNRTEYSGTTTPFEKELHLTNASLVIAQSYYSATSGNSIIPLSSADAKLCCSVSTNMALRLFSALVLHPFQTTIIGAKRAVSYGDAQPNSIDRFFDLLIYDISLAE